jgi:hypothetical protein
VVLVAVLVVAPGGIRVVLRGLLVLPLAVLLLVVLLPVVRFLLVGLRVGAFSWGHLRFLMPGS